MPEILFTQLISSGCGTDAELLKISTIYEKNIYSQWIKPSKPWVDTAMSGVHGLECRNYEFFIDGEPQKPIQPLKNILEDVHEFITEYVKDSVVLVTHSAKFQVDLLIKAIKTTDMAEAFDGVIVGFADTLPVAKEEYSNDPKIRSFSLAGLAKALMGVNYSGELHRASLTLPLFRKIAMKFLDPSLLVAKTVRYKEALAKSAKRIPGQHGFDDEAGPSMTKSTIQLRRRVQSPIDRSDEWYARRGNLPHQIPKISSRELEFSKQNQSSDSEDEESPYTEVYNPRK